MSERKRNKQTLSLNARLAIAAREARERAASLQSDQAREQLLEKARQFEMHIGLNDQFNV